VKIRHAARDLHTQSKAKKTSTSATLIRQLERIERHTHTHEARTMARR
jgi:hypothetical protein